MKKRITIKDLSALDADQKRHLNELWHPEPYDLAVARILRSVAEDEYDEYEFVVGDIKIVGRTLYLSDIRTVIPDTKAAGTPDEETADTGEPTGLSVNVDPLFGERYPTFGNLGNMEAEETQDADGENADDEYYEEEEEPVEEFSEEDLEANYERPSSLLKEDCLPLLAIGDMIEILHLSNYGKHDFYLTASTYEIGCELGREDAAWGGNREWEEAELCDVLWDSIKALL